MYSYFIYLKHTNMFLEQYFDQSLGFKMLLLFPKKF